MKAALVRPARHGDLPALAALAASAASAATSATSATSTNTAHLSEPTAAVAAAGETLLVAQAAAPDDEPAVLLGALRLRRAVGLGLPRVWYHVGCTVHAASELGLFHRQRTLMLGHDHTGASELADMAWAHDDVPLADQAATLHLLVQSALLLMARDRMQYAARLIAELPGARDSAGQSPFWHGLGRHFFSGDPLAAAQAHGADWHTHVAALLPRQPVYTSFLPAAAEAAIGQAHPAALLLREVLEHAGLRYGHHVNVDDAGPVLEGTTDDLPSLRRARRCTLTTASHDGSQAFVALATRADGSWRAHRVRAQARGAGLAVAAETMQFLGLAEGAAVWAVALGGAGD